MLKKIILGTLLAGLIAVLVLGAVNRTQSRSAGESASGNRQAVAVNASAAPEAQQGQPPADARAGRGYGRNGADGESAGSAAEAITRDWIILQGRVASVDGDTLAVEQADGTLIEIAGRGWQYAQEQGFAAESGDAVTLVGFWDGESFEARDITNLASGRSVALRDEGGRPMWVGRGRNG